MKSAIYIKLYYYIISPLRLNVVLFIKSTFFSLWFGYFYPFHFSILWYSLFGYYLYLILSFPNYYIIGISLRIKVRRAEAYINDQNKMKKLTWNSLTSSMIKRCVVSLHLWGVFPLFCVTYNNKPWYILWTFDCLIYCFLY